MQLYYGDGALRVKGSPIQHALITASHIGVWNPGVRGFICPATPSVVQSLHTIATGNLLIEGEGGQEHVAKMMRYAKGMGAQSRALLPASNGLTVNGVATKLYPYQARAFWLADSLRATMLSMCVGAGKCLMSIALLTAWGHKRILIVCPPHVLKDENTWPLQFDSHSEREWFVLPLIGGSTASKLEELKRAERELAGSAVPLVVMTNYETVWRDPLGKHLMNSLEWRGGLIMDEVHRIKSPTGIASKYMGKLATKMDRVLGLTGTVMPHSPMDVFGQYRAIEPGLFGLAWSAFRDQYAVVKTNDDIPIIVGYRNQQELGAKMDLVTFTAGSNVIDLPAPVDVVRKFDLAPKERKLYDKLEKENVAQIRKGEITLANALTKTLRLAQVTSGFIKTDQGDIVRMGTSKRELLMEELTELPLDEPVVVFCRFRLDIEGVQRVCKAMKRSFGEVSGRANDLREWQAGKMAVLAVQIQSAEGINLTRAHYGIFYSIGYSGGQYKQARGRLQRPGQRSLVRFSHFIARDTVNEAVYRAIEKNENVAKAIYSYLRNKA